MELWKRYRPEKKTVETMEEECACNASCYCLPRESVAGEQASYNWYYSVSSGQ